MAAPVTDISATPRLRRGRPVHESLEHTDRLGHSAANRVQPLAQPPRGQPLFGDVHRPRAGAPGVGIERHQPMNGALPFVLMTVCRGHMKDRPVCSGSHPSYRFAVRAR